MSDRWVVEQAWLGDDVVGPVTLAAMGGRFTDVSLGATDGVPVLAGCAVPGFVNAHSHAFQRDLRGAVERIDPANPDDDFWTWREEMYAQAGAMDPARIHDVARRCYRQMRASGVTAVGEFHYVHHQPDGTPYEDRTILSQAIIEAARAEGLRIALLDRKSTRLNSSHVRTSRMPSSA